MYHQTERRERESRNNTVELRKGPEVSGQANKSKRHLREKPGRGWQQKKHDLINMSIDDLREYLLDTEY